MGVLERDGVGQLNACYELKQCRQTKTRHCSDSIAWRNPDHIPRLQSRAPLLARGFTSAIGARPVPPTTQLGFTKKEKQYTDDFCTYCGYTD